MWQPNGNAASTLQSIPPMLLANFDPHHILEPERTRDGPKIERLIDIDGFSMDHVDASLLDFKTDYEPIDLYQNIYVTPQLVKRNTSSNSSNSNESTSTDIDYTRFFDRLESGEHFDGTNDEELKKETVKLSEEELKSFETVELTRKPRVLVPKVLSQDDLDPEDLIDEVLSVKMMTKCNLHDRSQSKNLANATNQSDSVKSQFPTLKVLNPPNIEATILEDNVSKMNKTKTTIPKQDDSIDLAAQYIRLKLNSNLLNDNKKPQSVDNAPSPKIKDEKVNVLNFEVIAMKKDAKAYRNKRVQKPESVTKNYTVGADYYEKSVVLPQIMARIKARQAFLEEKGTFKKRLILDSGSKLLDSGSKPVESSSKPVDSASSKLNKGKNGFQSTDIGRSVSTSKMTSSNNVPIKSANGLKSADFGRLNPIVLMADCNKEREMAWLQNRMFQNFIGK